MKLRTSYSLASKTRTIANETQNPNRLARMMASALKVEGALTEDTIAQVLSPMINDALHLEARRIRELIEAKARGGGPHAALWRELLGDGNS